MKADLELGVIGNYQISALIDARCRMDPVTGELWGNYPQTYSLVGIINSAMRLSISWEEAL